MARTPSLEATGAKPDRATRRQRVLLGGKLVFGVAEFSIDCAIRDLSETGARVKLPIDMPTADEVWLITIRGGVAYRATVACRKGLELGLTFTTRHDLRGPTPPSVHHLRMLWLDCTTR